MRIGEKVTVMEQVFAVGEIDCRDYTGETGTIESFPDPLGVTILFEDGRTVRMPLTVINPANTVAYLPQP